MRDRNHFSSADADATTGVYHDAPLSDLVIPRQSSYKDRLREEAEPRDNHRQLRFFFVPRGESGVEQIELDHRDQHRILDDLSLGVLGLQLRRRRRNGAIADERRHRQCGVGSVHWGVMIGGTHSWFW